MNAWDILGLSSPTSSLNFNIYTTNGWSAVPNPFQNLNNPFVRDSITISRTQNVTGKKIHKRLIAVSKQYEFRYPPNKNFNRLVEDENHEANGLCDLMGVVSVNYLRDHTYEEYKEVYVYSFSTTVSERQARVDMANFQRGLAAVDLADMALFNATDGALSLVGAGATIAEIVDNALNGVFDVVSTDPVRTDVLTKTINTYTMPKRYGHQLESVTIQDCVPCDGTEDTREDWHKRYPFGQFLQY